MNERQGPGPVRAGEEFPPARRDELREEDVTAADRLDDRVQEAEGLPESEDGEGD